MKILALETSGQTAEIAILDTQVDQVFEKELKTVHKISEILTFEIQELLNTANCKIADINIIAVGTGPGSYTGTRIGIATAKGLAHGLGSKIIGVTSFDALVEMVDEDYEDIEIIPLIDAKNNRAYYQVGSEQGCDNIENILEKLDDEEYVFVGSGARSYGLKIKEKFGPQAVIEERENVKARLIAQIADGRAQRNLFDNIAALKPLYITRPI